MQRILITLLPVRIRAVLATVLLAIFGGLGATLLPAADASDAPAVLPGTQPLQLTEPLDQAMVAGVNRFALRELEASARRRDALWRQEEPIEQRRARFARIIGIADERVNRPVMERIRTIGDRPRKDDGGGEGSPGRRLRIDAVRWRVLPGVTGEGLLVAPAGPPQALVIALPDADWTPEMFVGATAGVDPGAQLPRRLAEQGCLVLVPTLISRDDAHSGHPDVSYTNQPHREFIYRMSFEMGRHIIGYEVQKVQAALDAFEHHFQGENLPIGVCGIGEGALLALYSAAVEPRIQSALVCGYFQRREGLWQEPIYRNVWALLTEFGDAEIAGLIAPRALTIEACAVPEVSGPKAPRDGRRGGAAPGRIEWNTLGMVRSEYDRASVYYGRENAADRLALVASGEGNGPAGTPQALAAFLKGMEIASLQPAGAGPVELDLSRLEIVDSDERQKRQFDELVNFTQQLMHNSARVRDRFWEDASRESVAAWEKTSQKYRDHIYEEMIGKLPDPTMPVNVRTRKVLDEPEFVGYEVVLDVYPDVIAGGVLLLPRSLKEGERRPVVVCQHGLEGTPMDTITDDESSRAFRAYKAFARQLVKQGFIVYAPQNPYRGQDEFRSIQRKSNPLKRSLFSYIIRQHERTLDWLAGLPYVDPQRIAFYGLSYGGKTAVRAPPLLDRYCLSICSADFNEWIRKNVSNSDRYSYMFTGEYEMFEWNMGHTANYAELASLMAPRPFMVERGHSDGVAPDEWVAWEYAKVRRHYVRLGLGDKTEIEFFDGPHSINGKGTFAFLRKHLQFDGR